MTKQTTNQPIKRIRVGAIQATIWENKGANGAYPSVSITRSYKTVAGDFKDTTSFRAQDLLTVGIVANQAANFLDGIK